MTTANTSHHSTPTPPPTSAINWDSVGFKVHQVNGHAHVTWSNGKWGKVEFRQEELLQIHGFASCLNYGQVSPRGGYSLFSLYSNVLKDSRLFVGKMENFEFLDRMKMHFDLLILPR